MRRRVIGNRIELAEVEAVGTGAAPLPLELVLWDQQPAFALYDARVSGVGETPAVGARRAPRHRRAKATAAVPRKRIQRFRRKRPSDGGCRERGGSAGERLTACELHHPSYGSATNARLERMLSTIPVRLFAALLLFATWASSAAAEDGYDLWLRYRPVEAQWRSAYARRATAIVQRANSPTLDVAANELRRGIRGM